MARTVQEPIEGHEPGSHGDRTFDHPAFGQIMLSRIHGVSTLYGSDFRHHQCVRITIKRSQLRRGLSRDWHFSRNEIVSVDLSDAQWATFVSSFGVGEGVPCTIDSVGGKSVPEFPLRDSGQEYKAEADAKLAESVKALEDAIEAVKVNTVGLTKAKAAALLEPLQKAHRELAANVPFVAKQFAEHMETRVEKAKVEVNAYMTDTLMRAGLAHLQDDAPLLLDNDE